MTTFLVLKDKVNCDCQNPARSQLEQFLPPVLGTSFSFLAGLAGLAAPSLDRPSRKTVGIGAQERQAKKIPFISCGLLNYAFGKNAGKKL